MAKNLYLAFPVNYRAEEVQEILFWVKLGESGVVVGGSGSGKSNVAGILANRADITAPLLPKAIDEYAFFHLDVNGLPGESTSNFYRSLLQAMVLATEATPDIQQILERLIERQADYHDTFGLFLTVQRAHDLLIRKYGKHVVWLLDRFDVACQKLDATILNTLRSLRDQFKGQLSYIAFTREPLERLRDPSEFDEFYELMTMHTCWIRMMNEQDGYWVARQVVDRYQLTLDESEIQRVYHLCGGLPAFLRAAYSSLARRELPVTASDEEWIIKLLTLDEMKRNCREMWQSCEEEESDTLLAIAHGSTVAELDKAAVTYLKNIGWLRSIADDKVEIFSELFAQYVRKQKQLTGKITFEENQILVDGLPIAVGFTKSENRLMRHLLEHQSRVCSKDELMQAVYGDSIMRDENLVGLVRHARKKLKQLKINPDDDYIQTVQGVGYRFHQVG